MRKLLLILLCLALPLHAQSDKEAEKALQTSLINQTVYLRNMALGDVVNARWTGKVFDLDEPNAHLFAALVVEYVKFHGSQLEIDAQRYTMIKDPANNLAPDKAGTSVQIMVNLAHADKKTALPTLRDALFVTTLDAARKLAPRELGGTRPRDLTIQQGSPRQPMTEVDATHCDCADKGTPACAHKAPFVGFTPFKILKQAEPEFSEEARAKKLSGNVLLSLVIDTSGYASDIWVIRPFGFGLDEKAVEAVERYTFRPAACHDQPLRSDLHIEVNFQKF